MQESYQVTVDPMQSIGDIKATLEGLTGVRADRQVLLGDRVHVSHDQQTLASAGVARGTTLVMAEREPDVQAPHANMFGALRPEAGSEAEEEEEDEEYVVNSDSMESDNEIEEDADDVYYDDDDVDADFGAQNITARRPSVDPLIDADLHNITEGAQSFAINFESRYGPVHPDWYLGSYQHAVAEARRQSRPLFMYIHSDQYIESNIFCQTALCNEGVVELLRQNFVCWGWDITVGQNLGRFHEMMSGEGDVELRMRRIACPFCRIQLVALEGVETIDRFGFEDAERLYQRLVDRLVVLGPVLEEQRYRNERMIRERNERLQTQQEIDHAYQQSLEDDRRKAELKRKEEESERERELQEERDEEQAEARRLELEQAMLAEPPLDTKASVCELRFRFPEGEPETRRFLRDSATLHDLTVFAGARGWPDDEFALVTSFPKRTLNDLDPTATLAAMSLSAREQIHVSPRHD